MVEKLSCFVVAAFIGVVTGVALHVVGVVTHYWFHAHEDDGIGEIHMGLWRLFVTHSNGTLTESVESLRVSGFERFYCIYIVYNPDFLALTLESPMVRREEQYLMLAIAGINVLLCCVVVIRSFHICVGIVAFITISLMLVVAAQSYETTDAAMATVQEHHPHWPMLKLWWSFYLTFVGILLNIAATVVFLMLLLIKGGKQDYKAQHTIKVSSTDTRDKPQIRSISAKKHLVYEEVAAEKVTDSSYAAPSISYVYETDATECTVDFAESVKRAKPAAYETKDVEFVEFADTVKRTQPAVELVFAKTYSERL